MAVQERSFSVKLTVNMERQKVAYAIVGKEFVDVLSSVLTVPLGTLVRAMNNKSGLVGIDTLYKSIEDLEDRCFSNKASKEMILRPVNASGYRSIFLSNNRDVHSAPTTLYRCPKKACFQAHPQFSCVENTRCKCGFVMNSKFDWFEENWKDYWSEGTVFVEGDDHEFLMLDDLRIVKYDGDTLYSVIEQHGDDDPLATKDVIFDLTASGILELLREALTSSCPLSTLYFKNKRSGGDPQKGVIGGDLPGLNSSGMEENAYTQNGHSRKVYAKAYISPKTKRILCINAGAQFADLLFSFFTLPVGAIIKLLSKSSLIGCLDTLYRSIEELGTEHFKAETLHLLLQPKLHAHFGLKHSRLPIEERSARKETFIFGERRLTCCGFGLGPRKPIEVTEIDPKLGGLSGENQSGGGFANMDEKFLITEDLRIEIFSAKSMVDPLKKYQLRVSEVVRKKIWVDEITALHFLKACLVYPDPLAILPLADPSEREEPEGSGDDGEGDVDPSQKDFRDAGDKTRSDAKKKEAAPFLCSPFNRLDPMAFRRLAYEPEGVGLQTICSGRMDPGQCSNTAPK